MGSAPAEQRPARVAAVAESEEMPALGLTRRRMVFLGIFVLVSLGTLYFLVPQLAGLDETWERLERGDPFWLTLALAFQIAAMASYIAMFQGTHVPPGAPLTFRDSYLITMASLAATRIFAAGGAGGVALTAWALRRAGMDAREVAARMIAFLVLLYAVYMIAMIVAGFGLHFELLPGAHPVSVTLVPAIFALVVVVLVLAIGLVPADAARRAREMATRAPRRLRRLLGWIAQAPASMGEGVRFALHKLRHPDLAMLGALTWWACNVAVLWACFKAFGESPPIGVLVMGFFVGMLGNLLPLPGGIGGVDGGMIGAFAAFGVPGGLALVAVLAYRALAFWLPTIPGAIAYFGLRKRVGEWRTMPELREALRAAERREHAAAPLKQPA